MGFMKLEDRTCWNCGYVWTPIKVDPKACPMCHVYQDRAKYRRAARLGSDSKGNVAAIAVVVVLVVVAVAIAVFAAGLLSPFLRSGCTVQGAVVTLEGGAPYRGARVELGSGGSELGVVFTGPDGRYRFAIARDHCNGAVAQLLVSSGVDFKLVSLNLPAAPGETLTVPTVGL